MNLLILRTIKKNLNKITKFSSIKNQPKKKFNLEKKTTQGQLNANSVATLREYCDIICHIIIPPPSCNNTTQLITGDRGYPVQ